MFEIGSSLREARERRSLSYGQVEADTAIRTRYIRALEDEDFHILPGPTYTKGFLRAYAEYLGLDGQPFVDEFNSRHHDPRAAVEHQPITSRPRSRPQQRRRQRRESNLIMIALAAIVAVSFLVVLALRFPPQPTAPVQHEHRARRRRPGRHARHHEHRTQPTATAGAQKRLPGHAHAQRDHLGRGDDRVSERAGRHHRRRPRPRRPARPHRRPGHPSHHHVLLAQARLPRPGRPGQRHARHQRPPGVAAARGRAGHRVRLDASGAHRGLSRPTASILLTGNELLRGVIADQNGPHLAAALERLGLLGAAHAGRRGRARGHPRRACA